jgi:hypothetical protein
MRLLGQTEKGLYMDDEFDDIHPDFLQQYYGTTSHGVPRRRHQTGAGGPAEEEDSSDCDEEIDNLGDRIAADQQHNIRHAPAEVPAHACPFDALTDVFFCRFG